MVQSKRQPFGWRLSAMSFRRALQELEKIACVLMNYIAKKWHDDFSERILQKFKRIFV